MNETMRTMVCPKCGRAEADPAARFCDIDGTPLVVRGKLETSAALRAATPTAERSDRSRSYGSAGPGMSSPLERSSPPASPALAPLPTTTGISPWPLIAGGSGLLLLAAAASLYFTAGTNLESKPVKTQAHSDSEVDPPMTAEESAGRFASRDALLNRCYGGTPPLPRLEGGEEEEAFEIVKEVMRTGTTEAADLIVSEVTVEDERRVGDAVSRELEKQHPPFSDPPAKRRLDGVVARLKKLAPREADLGYSFAILSTQDLNAFMAPGGRGFITSALMNRTHEEDQLAFIVGHELAHSECQHSTRAVQIALAGRKLGGEVLGSGGEQVGEGLSVFSNRVLEATYDQDQEFEADRLGLCLAYLAGYDPRGGAGAMGTLASATPEASSAAPPTGSSRIAYDIISSHPPLSARSLYLKDLEGLIDARK